MRSFLRMNIYRSVKFSSDHVAPVMCVERRLRGAGFFRVPGERAKSARVSFRITSARPGRFIAGLGIIVPDERPAVSRALISFLATLDFHQHYQRNANKEQYPRQL